MHAEDNATEAEEDFREKENEYLHRISILEREVIKSYLKNRQLVARRGAPVSRHEPAELAFMRMVDSSHHNRHDKIGVNAQTKRTWSINSTDGLNFFPGGQ